MLMVVRPYRSAELNLMAIAVQIALVCVFFASLCISLHMRLQEQSSASCSGVDLAQTILGFEQTSSIVNLMIGFTLGILSVFAAIVVYQTLALRSMESVRLVTTRAPPDLTLSLQMKWHTFLSHIWSTGQDQAAIIKRQLQILIPGVEVFLDVDNLEEIGELEHYVDQTSSLILFLSRGYFYSANCLRELDHAIKRRKPLLLVHEANSAKGGELLSVLKEDCEAKGRRLEAVFGARDIIRWERIHDFQIVSLKQICAGVIGTLPAYAKAKAPPEVFVPGEISRQQLSWPTPSVVYVSSKYNPGVTGVARELTGLFGDKGLRLVAEPPWSTAVEPDGIAAYMLLYLNSRTFQGAVGEALAEEVRQARDHRLPIVMLHENDASRNGCDFGLFFKTTPEDLVTSGLFRKLAIAFYAEPHRPVSLALTAKALGADSGTYSVAASQLRWVLNLERSMSVENLRRAVTTNTKRRRGSAFAAQAKKRIAMQKVRNAIGPVCADAALHAEWAPQAPPGLALEATPSTEQPAPASSSGTGPLSA